MLYFILFLLITNCLQAKRSVERLDHSKPLQKLLLEEINRKNVPHSLTPESVKGVKVVVASPIKLTTAQIMGRAKESSPLVSAQSKQAQTLQAKTPGSISILNHFTAANYQETGQYGPSADAGKGKTQITLGSKGRIRTFLETGAIDNVLNISHDRFFSSVSNGGFTADPNIIYDPFLQRWFLFCGAGLVQLLLAMSDGDPIKDSTVWSFFVIDTVTPNPGFTTPEPYLDYPTLGLDQQALYCGVNVFDEANPNYLSSAAYVILKDSLVAEQPVVYAFRNLVNQTTHDGPFTLQGALNFDSNPMFGFFISLNQYDVLRGFSSQLLLNTVLYTMEGPVLSAPQSLAVTPYVNPLYAPALGSPETLFDPGVRLSGSHIRNGILRTVHEIGVDNTGLSVTTTTITRNAARYYGINIMTSSPIIVQQGTVFQPSANNDFNQRNFIVPSIMSNALNQVIVSATTCGAQERLNTSLTQIVNGVPGTPVLYTASTTNYFATEDWEFDPHSRWGDHTRLSIDPNDQMTFWPAGLWCHATNIWATEIAQVTAS